jgi:GNAT superfamily N-acetyltransferase
MRPTVRPPRPGDRADWDRLYAGYAAFYGVAQTGAMRDRVWGWLFDPASGVEGRVAEAPDGRLVGLAHFRAFARPLSATTGGFLDDLFVDPDARAGGVGAALIEAVRAEARARGWSVLRWITAADNATARSLYDKVARATPWVTYDLAP